MRRCRSCKMSRASVARGRLISLGYPRAKLVINADGLGSTVRLDTVEQPLVDDSPAVRRRRRDALATFDPAQRLLRDRQQVARPGCLLRRINSPSGDRRSHSKRCVF
jgi:hypothetical protein